MSITRPHLGMDQNPYRIAKDRAPVALLTARGERIVGDIFLHASARQRTGREDALEAMNAPEPFLPVVTDVGETVLVAKDHISEVEVAQLDDEQLRLGEPATVEVALARGAHRVGLVYFDSFSGRARVLDYLNRSGDRFLPLFGSAGAVLLNRRLIVRVHPLD